MKMLNEPEEPVNISLNRKQVIFRFEKKNITFFSRLIEGEYIDYKNIIKNEFLSVVRVNKNQLLSAIDRASIMATDKNKIVKFDIKEGYMTVCANSEVGKMSENVVINIEGYGLRFCKSGALVCIKVNL